MKDDSSIPTSIKDEVQKAVVRWFDHLRERGLEEHISGLLDRELNFFVFKTFGLVQRFDRWDVDNSAGPAASWLHEQVDAAAKKWFERHFEQLPAPTAALKKQMQRAYLAEYKERVRSLVEEHARHQAERDFRKYVVGHFDSDGEAQD